MKEIKGIFEWAMTQSTEKWIHSVHFEIATREKYNYYLFYFDDFCTVLCHLYL